MTFERLYSRHAGDVYRYALVVMRNPQDAEDVTQTTFLNAYRAMAAGQEPESPKNWLIAIAHNVCRQRFRQRQRRPLEAPLREDVAEAAVEEREDGYSAEDIQRALGQLAFSQRSALVLRELEGRSYAEIAEILGLSASAVETLLFRARRALREQLEGTLTCAEAELYLSKQADGELSRADRGQLRAHLRQCPECATLARKQRASRSALKGFWGGLPVPSAFLGGGGGVAVATKAAAVLVGGAAVLGGGYAAERESVPHPVQAAASRAVPGFPRSGNQVPVSRAGAAASASEPGSRRSRNRVAGSFAPPRRHVPTLPAHASPVAVAAVSKPHVAVPGSPRSGNRVPVSRPAATPAHPAASEPGSRRSRNQVAGSSASAPGHVGRSGATSSGVPPGQAAKSSPASEPGSRRSRNQVPESSTQAQGSASGETPSSSPSGQSKAKSHGNGSGAVAPEPVVPVPASPVSPPTTITTTDTTAVPAHVLPGHSKAGK